MGRGFTAPPRHITSGDVTIDDLAQLQTNTEKLNRVVSEGILFDGQLIEGIKLVVGTVDVGHGLGRAYRGFFVTKKTLVDTIPHANATPSSLQATTIRLTASAVETISIWVF